jgi:large subunit ribosomal protein L17
MRHGKKFAHLGRKAPHRKYMLANMACSLIEHKSINTTVAKAKALKRYIEPLITKSKNDSTHNRRIVFSYLKNKYAVTELFRDISVKIGDRPGGYTRIIKLGNRLGDNASMALIELVDYNTIYNSGSDSKKKTRRRRKSTKKSDESVAPAVEEAAPAVEEAEPAVEEAAPAVEEAAPAVEEAEPAVEEVAVEGSNDASENEDIETNSKDSEKKETDS